MALKTKREVLAQVMVCSGCCCGAVHRGKPEVPLEWLKGEWKSRGLKKAVQLTITGCLGPCDLTNVVRISGASEDIWLGGIDRFQIYSDLTDWASCSGEAGMLLPLPAGFDELRFSPFGEHIDAGKPV